MQRHFIWLVGLLALASASAIAAPPPAPPPGAVASAWEKIVQEMPDGTRVTTSRPIKDIAAWFQSMGAPVPPIAPQAPICGEQRPMAAAGGRAGEDAPLDHDAGVGKNRAAVVPQQHMELANHIEPPDLPGSVHSYWTETGFSDGWTVAMAWARSLDHPTWQRQQMTWTPPAINPDKAQLSLSADCDEQEE
jgi:hypothetical protein